MDKDWLTPKQITTKYKINKINQKSNLLNYSLIQPYNIKEITTIYQL